MEELEDEKNLKVTLAARVIPDLKADLLKEASEINKTPSSYVEAILLDRKAVNPNKLNKLTEDTISLKNEDVKLSEMINETIEEEIEFDEEISEEVEEIKPIEIMVDDLNLEDDKRNILAVCEAFEAQIKSLKLEKLEAEDKLSEVTIERDLISEKLNELEQQEPPIINFNESEMKVFKERIAYLNEWDSCNGRCAEDIILAALDAAIYNTEENPFGSALKRFVPKQ